MSGENQAPVIIKKVKKGGGDGHHGGAWKVAYADFVTAMMAFFLLMWLLNATTEVQRKGIADYFNPTIPINRISGGGDGAFGGTDIFTEQTLAQTGNGATQRNPAEGNKARGDTGVSEEGSENDGSEAEAMEEESLKGLEEMLTGKAGESMVSNDLARHIVTKITDEGLIVELYDLEDAPLFEPDSTEPTPVMTELVSVIAAIFSLVDNEVALAGYTAARPVVESENPVWTLSHGRANQVRMMLAETEPLADRIQRVSGFADRKPVVENPMSVRNNRTELILLREVK